MTRSVFILRALSGVEEDLSLLLSLFLSTSLMEGSAIVVFSVLVPVFMLMSVFLYRAATGFLRKCPFVSLMLLGGGMGVGVRLGEGGAPFGVPLLLLRPMM